MKKPIRLRSFLALAGSSLLAISSANAQTYYWDGNDGAAGFGTATGTWAAPTIGTTTSGWSTDSTGLTVVNANSVTTATSDAINFGNGATGLGAGTITVSGTVDAGDMTFASASGVIVLSGGTINLAATQTTTVNNATSTIDSILSGAGTSFTKAGTGTLILSGTNTYAGTTTVNGGTLTLSGNGEMAGTSGATIGNRGTLTLDNAATNLGNRTAGAIASSGGTINFLGNAAATTETLGALTLNAGALTINSTAGAGGSTLTIPSITRSAVGGTLYLNNNTGANVVLSTAPALVNSILKYAVVTNGAGLTSFANYSVSAGTNQTVVPLALASHNQGAETTWASGNNVRPTADVTISATSRTVYTLTLDSGMDWLASGGIIDQTLNISGAVLQTGGTSIVGTAGGNSDNILVWGGNEAIFHIIGSLQLNRGNTNSLTGTAGLTKSGAGTLILNGVSTLTIVTAGSAVNINEGILELRGATALLPAASATPVNLNGATLRLSNNAATIYNAPLVVGSDSAIQISRPTTNTTALTHTVGTLSIGSGRTLSVTANAAQFTSNAAYGLTTGVLTLTSGGATIDVANNGSGIGTMTVAAPTGNFTLTKTGSGDLVTNSITSGFSGAVDIQAGRVGWSGASVIAEAQIFSGAGGIIKSGAGTVTLSGTNSYSGGTTVAAGTLQLNNATALGSTSGALTVNTGGTLDLNGFDLAVGNFTGTGGIVTTGVAGAKLLTIGTGNGNGGTFAGVIQDGSGSIALTKTGTGTITLSGANTYNGNTTINGGTLGAAATGSLGSATNTLVFNGSGATLQATGAITSPATRAVTMTSSAIIDTNGQAISIAGNMTGASSSLTKNGTNTLTLSGTNNYFGTTVNAGTLAITKEASLNTGAAASWTAANLNVISAATLQLNVDLDGSDGFTIANLNTLLGNISVANTAVEGLQAGAILALDTTNAGGNFTPSSAITNSTGAFGGIISLTKLGAGTLILDQANTYTGQTTITAGTLQLGSGGATGSLSTSSTITVATGANFVVNRTGTVTQGTTFSGLIIEGLGGFTQAGSGTTILNQPNTFSGTTTVSGGTLTLTNALALQNSALVTTSATSTISGLTTLTLGGLSGATGDLGSANVLSGYTGTITALTLNPQSGVNVTYGGVISNGSGTMTLTKTGAGTQNLEGANTYTGVTTLTGGTLSVATIGNGGVAGNLGQATNVAGNLVFDGGTLDYTGANATSDRAFTIIAGRTATINTANNLSLAGATGSATTGALTKTGAGILTLTAANSYSGVTTVSGGTLSLTGSLMSASLGNVVVEATGTLGVSGTLTGSATTTFLTYGTTAGVSTVNISTGANISLFAIQGADVAGAVSIWNQTGGAVTLSNGVAEGRYLANTGYGCMNLSGGSFSTGRFSVANHTGTAAYGVARIGGGAGTATFSPSDVLHIGRGEDTIGELTVLPNGIVDHNGASEKIFLVGNGADAIGCFNIVGGTVKSDTTSIQIGNGRYSTRTVSMTNLGSGSLEIGKDITWYTGGPGVGFFNKAYVNFAGGTVKVTDSGITTMLLPATDPKFVSLANTIFGAVTNSTANNNGTGANSGISATVGTTQDFTGGVTINTNTFDATISGPLVAPTGGGVAQGNLSVTGGSDYSGPPIVVFSSPTAPNATPAAGYAIISGGAVTGIVITAPGSYASTDTVIVTLSGGGGTGAAVASIAGSSLTANTSGGLTKTGLGTLLLNGTNTYTGLTTVTTGTLGGTGTIAGSVTVEAAGSLAPGASAGTLSIGGVLNISAQANGGAGKLNFELGPIGIGSSDRIALTGSGSLTIGGNFLGFSDFNFSALSGLQNGTYKLITSANAISGGLDTTPANLTGPIGAGTGILQITGNDVELLVSGADSAYDTWKLANAPGSNPDDDTDGDGVPNAVEFVLGGTTPTNDLGKLPVVSDDGTNVVFTFFRAQSSIDPKTGLSIEVGTDLATWNTAPSPYTVPDGATAGPPVKVEKGVPAAYDTITLTVTKSPDPKKFARLKVVITP